MSQDNGKAVALLVTVLSVAVIVPGWLLPCFTLAPSFGATLDVYLILYFPDEMAPKTVSLFGGIAVLLGHGDYGIGGLLLAFTVIFPAVKLLVLLLLCLTGPDTLDWYRHLCHEFLKYFGKWSMLDVFAISVLVIAFKEFPGGTRIRPEWGLLVYGAAIILSIAASILVKRAEAERYPAEGSIGRGGVPPAGRPSWRR
jgi:paraquat-inducible protein A